MEIPQISEEVKAETQAVVKATMNRYKVQLWNILVEYSKLYSLHKDH
jgi:hypothetical protein